MIHKNIVLVILFTESYLCHAYMIQCPHISQWNYSTESFQCFPSNKYLCLYNILVNRFEENCRAEEEKARPGYKYVLSPNPDRVQCLPEYYQPFIFTSFGNSQCVYKKSTCNEEGQVIATNGSTETDRTCRCDYTKHYVYVTPPNNMCSCKPAEEDCSCYFRPCIGDNEIMISDYRCISKDRKPPSWQIRCKEITASSSPPSVGTIPVKTSYKQFTKTRVSTIEASVIMMFFAVLFVILVLVICVNVRPHVTKTEVVYREDLIVTENYGKNITVIGGGESLQLKCEFTSKLSVKSITWQQRELDGVVQPVYSIEYQTSSLTSQLMIDNLNSKHSGRYECILTNKIGLSNATYDHCPKFCNILRDLPVCRPEEMNYVDIIVCSLPDKYQTISVFKGTDGTLEIIQQNYTNVMWFKHEEKLTRIKPTDKYKKYTHNKQSLTIKAAGFTDVGRYVGVVVDGEDRVQSIGFKLRVIPQDDIHNQVLQHRKDKTYVRTDDVDKVNTCLQQYGTVVLTGRAGTGKSKLCLEIASLWEENDYLPYVVDLSNNSPEDFGHSKILYIIDCNGYTSEDPEQLKTLLRDVKSRENVQMLITSRSTDRINVQTILQESSLLKEGNMIDLNKSLTSEEKKEILNKHMVANNITESSPEESNLKEILVNDEIQVKIDTKTIEEIIKTEPLHGFPKTVVNFCKDRQGLHLGKTYFTNLPESLECEIFRLAVIEGNTKSAFDGKMKYCVLAYIATDENKCLDVRDINTKRFTDLYQALYTRNISEIDINSKIKDATKDLDGVLLIEEGVNYKFIHPYVLTTIYASHEYFTYHLIEKGSFSEIKEFIRSSKYNNKEGEMVCICHSHYKGLKIYRHLCIRLLTDASKDGGRATDVGMYIYKQFIKLRDDEFRDKLISHLESRIASATKDKVPNASVRRSVSEEQIDQINEKNAGFKISFWQTVLLMDELTDYGKDLWVLLPLNDELAYYGEQSRDYPLNLPDIILLCGLISTCLDKRQEDACKEKLLMQYKSKVRHEHESFFKTLMQSVDIYGNTFFHYLVIFLEKESCRILQADGKLLSKENRSIFGQSNKMNVTPLEMAAYLGKQKLFTLLLNNTEQDYLDENQKHLRELTAEGRIFRYHDTKSTAKDKEDNKMSLNFEEGLLKYIKYGKEKNFLDILELHKKTTIKKKDVRKRKSTKDLFG